MNDSFIPPRSIRVAVERMVRYYVMVRIDGAILAGPFDDKHEAFKAKRKFLRHQREEKKRSARNAFVRPPACNSIAPISCASPTPFAFGLRKMQSGPFCQKRGKTPMSLAFALEIDRHTPADHKGVFEILGAAGIDDELRIGLDIQPRRKNRLVGEL
jgi:hypothetical protein